MYALLKYAESSVCAWCVALVVSDIKVPVGSSGFLNASLGRLDLSNADGRRWYHIHGMDVDISRPKSGSE